jgi:capsular exopolysaccharide synthesis family protein
MYSTATLVDNDEYLEREREIARMLQSRKGLAAKKATLEAVIAKTDATLAKLPVAETEADTLARDYAAKSDRYTEVRRGLNQAIQDVEQAKAGNLLVVASWAGPNGQTMNHPEIPAFPGAQKTTIASIMAALLLSLLGSSLVFLAMDYLDTSVRDSKDVERILDVPVNGVVPRLPAEQKALMAKITDSLPASPHAEAYRFLGTDILLSAAESPFKTVMVATAKPNQGGTSTICNLAITLAQAGQSVALVDADLRRPSLHHVFNVPNDQGLSTVLANGKLPGDVLQRTEVENLYVMTGGPIPENAWKLLRSPKMKDVISDLQRDFDFVLFDTPSAAVFADAATLATMVDGVLLVVRAQEQPSGSEMQVKNLLNKTRARIVGVVLNDVPLTQVDSARYFEEYYGDGHKTEAVAAAASGRPALPQRASDDEI